MKALEQFLAVVTVSCWGVATYFLWAALGHMRTRCELYKQIAAGEYEAHVEWEELYDWQLERMRVLEKEIDLLKLKEEGR